MNYEVKLFKKTNYLKIKAIFYKMNSKVELVFLKKIERYR